jgi:hypothetical protein
VCFATIVTSRYEFVTRWRVDASAGESFDVISRAMDYPRWWPAVWLRVEVLEPGDERGVGRRVKVLSRGWLPYRLRWTATTIAIDRPRSLTVRASGDFDGEGRWTLTQHAGQTEIVYHWNVEANKPLLRYLSFLLRPIFAANHRWAMARGEDSLRLELARRRASPPQ